MTKLEPVYWTRRTFNVGQKREARRRVRYAFIGDKIVYADYEIYRVRKYRFDVVRGGKLIARATTHERILQWLEETA